MINNHKLLVIKFSINLPLIAAAKALANFVRNSDRENIIPSAFDEGVANAVAESMKNV